jgi:acetyl-CoA carboxylase biotin carboxyl carrier protein
MAVTRPKTERSHLDLREIKKLIEMIEKSPVTDFELVDRDLKIRISKNGAGSAALHAVLAPSLPAAAPVVVPATPSAIEAPPPAPEAYKPQLFEVKSPMVGTFYRAPAPDADPYVRVGDMVEPGKVLCIVEAMKLMNELECEVRGRIVEVLVENAQPVEFGQALFRIDSGAA